MCNGNAKHTQQPHLVAGQGLALQSVRLAPRVDFKIALSSCVLPFSNLISKVSKQNLNQVSRKCYRRDRGGGV